MGDILAGVVFCEICCQSNRYRISPDWLYFEVNYSFIITDTCLSLTWPPCMFSFSLRRVYVINKEVCVRTVCAHEELLRGGSSVIMCVCICVFAYVDLLFQLWLLCVCVCVCVFSGPVPWSVLSLWRCSTERSVFINRRKLRKELWWLLIEYWDQGHYLPKYCRFSTTCPHPKLILLCSLSPSPFLLTFCFDSSCMSHYNCVESTSTFEMCSTSVCVSHVCLPCRSCVYG